MNSYARMNLSDLEFMCDQTDEDFVEVFLNEVYSEFMGEYMTEYGVEEEVMDTRLQYDPEKELIPERAGIIHADTPEDSEQENFIVVGPSNENNFGFNERLLKGGLGEEYLHEYLNFTDTLPKNQAEEVEETIGRIWQLYCHNRIDDRTFREDYMERHQIYWNRNREQGSGDRIRELSEFLLQEFDNRKVNQEEVMTRIISRPEPLTRIYTQKFE